jgi:hypothetical protein
VALIPLRRQVTFTRTTPLAEPLQFGQILGRATDVTSNDAWIAAGFGCHAAEAADILGIATGRSVPPSP